MAVMFYILRFRVRVRVRVRARVRVRVRVRNMVAKATRVLAGVCCASRATPNRDS